MKLSILNNPIGKPASGYPKHLVTYNWLSAEVTPAQLVAHIEQGKPFAIAQYQDGHRLAARFLASDLIAIDVDGIDGQPLTTVQYQALLADPFLTQYAFAVIQSASSKPDAYKARILFHLDQLITQPDHYKQLVIAVMQYLPLADPACKDAARFFYGGHPGRKADFLNLTNRLPVALLEADIAKAKATAKKATPPKPFTPRLGDSPTEERTLVEQALACLPDTALSYNEWVSVLMALSTVPYGLELAQQWTSDTQMGLPAKFASFTQNSVTLGSLFHLALQRGFCFPKREGPLDFSHLLDIPDDTPVHPVCDRFLGNVLGRLDHPVIAIKSPIGTGKTEWLINQLQGKSVLQISHRRSLVANTAARQNAKGLTIKTYSELDPRSKNLPDSIIITYNSLNKLLRNDRIRPFDVIVLDEIEQGLAHLVGGTFSGGKGHRIFQLLVRVMREASQVVALDADLGKLTLDFLKFVRPDDPIHFVHNTFPVYRGHMLIYNTPDRALESALRALKSNYRIAIACDSLARATSVYKMLIARGIRAYCITSKNSDLPETQEFLADINNRIDELQAFVYTSSVGTGVDIQSQVDVVFGLFDNRSITPQEQLQLIGRCRKAERFIIGSYPMEGHRVTDCNVIYNAYKSNWWELTKWGITVDRADTLENTLTPPQEAFLRLVCQVEGQNNASMNGGRQLFIQLARREYILHFKDDSPDSDIRTEVKEARKSIKDQHKTAVLEAPSITEKAYKAAKKRMETSPELEAGYERGLIEDFYQMPITEAIYNHAEQGGMDQVTAFINYHSHLNKLRAIDQYEIDIETDTHRLSITTPRMAVIRAIVSLLFPNGFHERRFSIAAVQAVLPEVERIWGEMQGYRIFGHSIRSETPIGILRAMFKRLGLSFSQDWSNGVGYYRLFDREIVQAYSLARLEGLDADYFAFEIAAIRGGDAYITSLDSSHGADSRTFAFTHVYTNADFTAGFPPLTGAELLFASQVVKRSTKSRGSPPLCG